MTNTEEKLTTRYSFINESNGDKLSKLLNSKKEVKKFLADNPQYKEEKLKEYCFIDPPNGTIYNLKMSKSEAKEWLEEKEDFRIYGSYEVNSSAGIETPLNADYFKKWL